MSPRVPSCLPTSPHVSPCLPISPHTSQVRLELARHTRDVLVSVMGPDGRVPSYADTYVLGSRTLRKGYKHRPPPCVLYALEAQGSLPRAGPCCAYSVRVPTSGVPYVTHTLPPQVPSGAVRVTATHIAEARTHEQLASDAGTDAQGSATLPGAGGIFVGERYRLDAVLAPLPPTSVEFTVDAGQGPLELDVPRLSLGTVNVRVVRATGLIAGNTGGSSDPYVVVQSGGSKTAETSVKKLTLSPEWDETLQLSLYDAAAPLSFEVRDLGTNKSLGVATIPGSGYRSMGQIQREPGAPMALTLGLSTQGALEVVVTFILAALADGDVVRLSAGMSPS